jgi:predicted DNA-binding protein YlxM (UPF0122 family)
VKEIERVSLLFDFYGPLLTERQQALLQAYYLEDLSLGEIAEIEGVSRQAVQNLLKRSVALLDEYEAKLGFIASYQRQQARLADLARALQSGAVAEALALTRALQADEDPPESGKE